MYDPTQSQGQKGEVAGNNNDINNVLLYEIKGKPAFAYADIHLKPSQRIVTDANHMLWMNRSIDSPTTECYGGCGDAIWRSCAEESCCFNTYTNNSQGNQKISVGYNDPGDILAFGVAEGSGWIMSQGVFIAGTDNLDIRGKCAGCCGLGTAIGDEGFILTHVRMNKNAETPTGVFLAGGYGAIVRHDIPPQQVLFISRGLFFAAHEDTKIQIGIAGGLKNACCSGAAIVMKFYGPATVYSQSRNPESWNPAKRRPREKKRKRAGGGIGGAVLG